MLVLCVVNNILNDSLLPLDCIPIVLQVIGFSADVISLKQYLGKEVKMKMKKAMSATLAISAVHSFVVVSTDHLLKVKPSSMMEFVFKQGLVTMGVTYLLNIVMEYVSYISFTVFETSLALHTLIPEIIKLTAFAKVTYCIVYQVFYKRYAWKWLNYSSYSIQ